MTNKSRPLCVFSTLALSLCAFSTSPVLASEASAPTSRVLNGETVPECGFAPVAYIGNCTATLVHPEIVLHAQHCGKPKSISLTHGGGGGIKLDVDYCKTFPGAWSTAKDFAFCKLKTPVTEVPPIPVAFGCEVDKVVKDVDIVHCGFGANGGSGSGNKGFGTKRWGANKLGGLKKSGEYTTLSTAPSKIVSCAGDSGGPLLMRMEDKTWRVIGVASTINGGGCSGSSSYNSYSLTAPGVAWVEKESGVDITPCFDPDGTWNPTKDCGKFYMGDHEGHGTWKDGCKGTPVSGFSSTCGDPFGEDGSGGDSKDSPKDEPSDKPEDSKDEPGDEPKDSKGDPKGSNQEPEPSTTPDEGESDGEGSEGGEDPAESEEGSQAASGDESSQSNEGSGNAKGSSNEDEPKDSGCSLGGRTAPSFFALGLLLLGLGLRRRRS